MVNKFSKSVEQGRVHAMDTNNFIETFAWALRLQPRTLSPSGMWLSRLAALNTAVAVLHAGAPRSYFRCFWAAKS